MLYKNEIIVYRVRKIDKNFFKIMFVIYFLVIGVYLVCVNVDKKFGDIKIFFDF